MYLSKNSPKRSDSSFQTDNEELSPKARETLTRKDLLSIVVMPLVLVLLTAILGTAVGIWLQNRSFRHNEVFKARLDRIMTSQREAAEILVEVHEARRQIRSNEDFIHQEIFKFRNAKKPYEVVDYYRNNNPMKPSMAVLQEAQLRLDALADYAKSLSLQSPVPPAIQAYSKNSDGYLGCLRNNVDFKANCTDEYPDLLDLMKQVVTAHSAMVDDLILEHQ